MKIDLDVLEVLSVAEISADGVQLSGQLDRKLYVKTAKVLEAGGAKWDRKRGMHVFDSSAVTAASRIEQAILTGDITTHQDIDFFPTPDPVIDMMLEAGDHRPTYSVLEPSAGRGAIARRIQAVGASTLCCIEKGMDNLIVLRRALQAIHADFLECVVDNIGLFDRIYQNPPFSRQQDIAHIRHAYDFLRPGGRLVSIASAGINFRQNTKTLEFIRWMGEHDFTLEELPAGSFKSSGTGVNTVLITIDKPED